MAADKTMSKDDACKVMPAGKHKERKPKKPHYIPRPWGKPYNYKCFQCPFTCMEKSHLYNHMKYSLCKNSLSLLIESDWPYKKGNLLPPFQPGSAMHQTRRDEQGSEQKQRERMSEEGGREDQEEQGAEDEALGKQGDQAEKTGPPRVRPSNSGSREEGVEGNKKKTKQQESELLMADMLSLEDQLLRARSVEVEAQLKHYKFSKTCLAAPGLLSEQWRLLASSHTKTRAEGAQSRVNTSIPCYPPPANLVDYQDPTGLNLSLLGVGYPISPSIFSYMNSAIPGAASGVSSQTHAQLAQLPFLASAAQLMHPTSHTDRPLVPPRFYYPFLCEHTFGVASNLSDTKTTKATPNNMDSHHLSGFQPKVNLWKVPALRPGAAPVSQAGWASPQTDPGQDQIYKVEEKLPALSKDSKASLGLKRAGAPMGKQDVPSEKIPNLGFTLDILKNIQAASSMNPTPETHSHQNSLQEAQLKTLGLWQARLQAGPQSEASTHSSIGAQSHQDSAAARTLGTGAPESVTALLSDLSKALQEYQEAESKMSHLEKEDLPAQHHLWEHLSKIRNELSHIHQALEQTTRQSDGPLDLSFKRELSDCQTEESNLRDNMTETEEEQEPEEEKNEHEDEREREAMRASLETRKQSLDMLIKMSQASVVNGEVLSPGSLGVRPSPSEALWPNRTTKCEADSSVLLCPDGRSVVFADIPKVPKRPPSIHRAEGQSPVSPLTAAES